MRSFITRLFPTPSFLRLASVGLDASENTLRLVELEETHHGFIPLRTLTTALPPGALQDGRVMNQEIYTTFLKGIKKKYGVKFARVSIPESQIYSFTLKLDPDVGSDIRSAIELSLEDNIPLKAIETVFDYQILSKLPDGLLVQVVAIAEAGTTALLQCYLGAGIIPTSFEMESQAIARALLPRTLDTSAMLVDIGERRTVIAIVTKGTVVFSSTLEFGGAQLTETLAKSVSVSLEEAEKLKLAHGFRVGERKDVFESLASGLSVLKDEINRRFIYWHEKRQFPEVLPAVDHMYLTGGHSSLPGLAEYLSVGLKIPVSEGNPWTHCFSFDTYIPSVSREDAIGFTTAIGLALVDYIHD